MILFLDASARSERRWAGTQWCYNLEDLSERCGLFLVFIPRLPAHGPLEAEEIQRLGPRIQANFSGEIFGMICKILFVEDGIEGGEGRGCTK